VSHCRIGRGRVHVASVAIHIVARARRTCSHSCELLTALLGGLSVGAYMPGRSFMLPPLPSMLLFALGTHVFTLVSC
jgi:hypothetical protein